MSTLIVAQHIPVDATAGPVSMALPTVANPGDSLSCEKYDASANAVTITGNVRGTAGASLTLKLKNESVTLRAKIVASVVQWWPVADHKTLGSLDGRFGRPCTTDGTGSLPTPAGVGLEFVITAAGLQDIRFNGTSL